MTSAMTALITGASKGGIGDALAREFHGRGFRVFATVRTPSKADHLKEMGIEIVQLDVTISESIQSAARKVTELTGGTLDILVNNSGVGYQSSILDADIATAKELFDVNIWGLIEVTQALSPLLIASKGTVVNIGSVLGRIPIPFLGIYGTSKAALDHLSAQMRSELKAFDIKVIHVIAGGIRTPFFDNANFNKLPETSPYWPGWDSFKSIINGDWERTTQTTTPEQFATDVVNNALKKNPSSCQYSGQGSWGVWFFSRVLWRDSTDLVLKMSGIPNLKSAITQGMTEA